MTENSGNIRPNRKLHLPGVIIERIDTEGETQIEAVLGADVASLEGDDGAHVTVGLPAELHEIIGEMLKKEGYKSDE